MPFSDCLAELEGLGILAYVSHLKTALLVLHCTACNILTISPPDDIGRMLWQEAAFESSTSPLLVCYIVVLMSLHHEWTNACVELVVWPSILGFQLKVDQRMP